MNMTTDELRAFLRSIPADHLVYEHIDLGCLDHRASDGDPLPDADMAYEGTAAEMLEWLDNPDGELSRACRAEERHREERAAWETLNSHTPKTPVREFFR